tara:strand:- start:267 stop:1577 length:1311 start_codon:yes stop_codon:yes gene_type:complete
MNSKSFFVKSYGCQMNVYDSEKIASILENKGMIEKEEIKNADVVIFNTCNIRDKAAHKVYSDIGRVTKLNKNKTIAVVGCVAQAENSEMFNKNSNIDIVLGPQSYHLLPKMIYDSEQNKTKLINTDFIINEKFDYITEEKDSKGVSSAITIQEGCDKFCSFCVVPFTRGPEYSRYFNDIKLEAESVSVRGASEIILLGQNVNAYNYFYRGKNYSISYLINLISEIEKVKRIRYTTSHPINMSDELINLHAENKKLMPFLHLPVQSGSDQILKKMNRRYNSYDYRKIIEKLKKSNPDIEISSDFIVGYPGETEKDFNETLKLVEEVKFTQSYSFIYNERPGTKSASEKDEISIKIKKERLSILQNKLKEIQLKYNQSFYNKYVKVLVENQSISNPRYFFGRTPFMQSVYLESEKIEIGKEMNVKITSCNHKSLYGIA